MAWLAGPCIMGLPVSRQHLCQVQPQGEVQVCLIAALVLSTKDSPADYCYHDAHTPTPLISNSATRSCTSLHQAYTPPYHSPILSLICVSTGVQLTI